MVSTTSVLSVETTSPCEVSEPKWSSLLRLRYVKEKYLLIQWRSGCLELYYCNMVEWFWCDSSLIFDDHLVSFSALTLLVWSSGL